MQINDNSRRLTKHHEHLYIQCLRPTTATALVLGMMGMWLYTKRTLPDYLNCPCIFRRGQLSWVPWEVFHAVLCLIIYIGRTSFGGDSYRVVFFWVPWEVFHTVLCLIIYLPYIFRRGQLSLFFFWVSWEVFHTVLCQKTATEDGGNLGIY